MFSRFEGAQMVKVACLSIGLLLVFIKVCSGQFDFDVADRTHFNVDKEGFLETEMIFRLPNGAKGDYIFNKIRQIVTCEIMCSNGEICFAIVYIRCEDTIPLKCNQNRSERCRLPEERRGEDSYHPGHPNFYPYPTNEQAPQYRPPNGDNYVYNRPQETYPVRPIFPDPNYRKYIGYPLIASPTVAPGYRPGHYPGSGYINSPDAGYTYDSGYRNGTNSGNSVSCIFTILVSMSIAVMRMFWV